MITRFYLGKTKILTKKFSVIPAAGVGNLEFVPCDSIWTGDCHIYTAYRAKKEDIWLSTHISVIDQVATRSSLDEDDEEWKVLFKREAVEFSYEYEAKLDNCKQVGITNNFVFVFLW
jgi:hypothetical protein